MKRNFSKNSIRDFLQENRGPVRLNVGCGTDYKKSWINIDNNSDNNIEKLDLNWDLRNRLPFEDGSVDYIFNEHFLEHLTVEEGQVAIMDFMRVLKAGGVLRIAMPDLEMVVGDYIRNDVKANPVVKNFNLDFVKTRAELMNMSFRWWGHQWLYDWEELSRRLREAGCKKIIRAKKGESKHPVLRNLEIRDESKLVAEVTK